ncbi:helix-turn-helix transcriptional regulator [Deinococcus sp. NW-56]|uniref:helix-turn-helix domain-containing protein n=1 Tax=Deinococcus sp. NW-56 TaxID=2080419 RepID=UPI000CF3BB46|nr:helix-turn-helix transcriptional regulator [Deinococcus sp. NW-56]
MYRDLPELLEHHLDERGLSQADFARMVGVNRATVNGVLQGKEGLSLKDWGRWFGALHLKIMFGAEPIGASMGFFINGEDVWAWLLKRLARSRRAAPLRTSGEFQEVLHHAGVSGWYADLLPQHLAPVMESGWLWREGSDTPYALAARIQEAMEADRA